MSASVQFSSTGSGRRRGVVRSNAYYMLVSALPALPPRFEVDRLPITLERLQSRLRMLEPEDADEIQRMLDALKWSAQFAEASDAAVARRYGELMQGITNPLVHEVLATGMNMRMVLAALRRRRNGLGPPTAGIGEWAEHIRRHFNQPDLALGHVYSWLVPFNQMLERGDVLALYQQVLRQAWSYLRRRAQDYDTFSFEAVVLYIARWDVMRRWLQLQQERGRMLIESLVTEAMGEHVRLYG